MKGILAVASDTLRGCARGAVLRAVLLLCGLGTVGIMEAIVHVPATYMQAGARLMEQGQLPGLTVAGGATDSKEEAHILLQLSEVEYEQVMKDTARGATLRYVIGIGGSILAILIGVFVNDTRSGRIEPLVARPVSRSHIALGQLLGGVFIVLAGIAVMALCLYVTNAAMVRQSHLRIFYASALLASNFLVALCLAYYLATTMHAVAATSISLGFCYSAGLLGQICHQLVEGRATGLFVTACRASYLIMPRMSDIKKAADDALFGEKVLVGLGPALAVNGLYLLLLAG